MANITLPTTLVDGTIPTASQFNNNFSTVYNEFNGSIDNSNIKSSAAITESKIAFNTSTGHVHNGTDSKLISVKSTYGAFIAGTPAVDNDLGVNPRVRTAATATTISAYARTAPTGSSLTVQVYNVTQAKAVASLSITAGNNSASSTSMTNAALTAGDILRFDVTAIGSTIAGANITVQIDCTEP